MADASGAEQESPLISASSILILSGFLLGVSVAEPLGDLSFHVFSCGTTGLISYIALEMTGLRKEKTALLRDREILEARLQRHITTTAQMTAAQEQEKRRLLEWLKNETESLTH